MNKCHITGPITLSLSFVVCTIPMGVENRYIISGAQIKASSALGSNHSLSKREAVGVQMPWTPE